LKKAKDGFPFDVVVKYFGLTPDQVQEEIQESKVEDKEKNVIAIRNLDRNQPGSNEKSR
jgi:hypothetical protein